MVAVIQDAEIRGCTERVSQKTERHYLSITLWDKYRNLSQVIDWNTKHKDFYTAGVIADIILNIQTAKGYTYISVMDFKPKNDH